MRFRGWSGPALNSSVIEAQGQRAASRRPPLEESWCCAGWSAGAGEAVGAGGFEGSVGEEFGVPSGTVEQAVVPAAEQNKIGDDGDAVEGHPYDVVNIAPPGPAVALTEAAVLIADDDRISQAVGHHLGRLAEVEDLGDGGRDQAAEFAVAQHGRQFDLV